MMEQQHVSLAPGKHLGVYEIKGVEDVDPVCITYRAWNHHLQTEAAIREFFPRALARRADDGQSVQPQSVDLRDDYQAGLAKFLAEATKLLPVQHPSVEHMHNVLEVHGTAYLVMDYQAGTSLAAQCQDGSQPQFTEHELESMALALLEALQNVHAQGLLHEGISPASIKQTADGAPVLVNLARIRLGSVMQDEARPVPIAEGYAAPEQYHPQGHLGPWTDLYALGAVLYCCLYGRTPGAASARASAWQAEATEREPLREQTMSSGRAPLRDIIDWMLSPRIEDRPQSAEVVMTRLRALHDETAPRNLSLHTAIPSTSKAGLWAALRHAPARAGAGAIVVLGLLLGIFWYSQLDRVTSKPGGISVPQQAEVATGEKRLPTADAPDQPTRVQPVSKPNIAAEDEQGATEPKTKPVLALAQEAQRAPTSAPRGSAAIEEQLAATSPPEAAVQPQPEQAVVEPGLFTPAARPASKPGNDFSLRSVAEEQQPLAEPGAGVGASETPAQTVEAVEHPARAPGNGDSVTIDQTGIEPDLGHSLSQAKQTALSKGANTLPVQKQEQRMESGPQQLPAQPEASRATGEAIERHLAAAAEDLKALRLTTPRGNNAFEHYEAVLDRAPDHPQAHLGLELIVERYVWLIEKALQEQHLARARIYLRRAQKVLPDAPALRRLHTELKTAQQ